MSKKKPKLTIAQRVELEVADQMSKVRQINTKITADLAFDIAELIVAARLQRASDIRHYTESICQTLKAASAPGFESKAFVATIEDVVSRRIFDLVNNKPRATLVTESVTQYCDRGGLINKVPTNKASESSPVLVHSLSLDDLGL